MEASSPLAAMHPAGSMYGHYGFRSIGTNNFNFRDLSMKKSQSDYFNMMPMRGSSPTASLAADFGQNLGLGISPHVHTPSRRLFSNGFSGGFNGHGNLTTPPLPSSSPGPGCDSMDISPLPHKAPFTSSFEIQLQSPTPELTSADSSILSLPSPPLDALPEPTKLTFPLERRKPTLLRPGLSRTKGFSTGSVPQKPSTESRLPPFRFGNGVSKLSTSSSMTLSEIFVESPVHERPAAPVTVIMAPPRPRQPLAGLAGNVRNGSPVSGHVRKTSNPLIRPRKQFRRSLSMFEHPEDIMKQEKATLSTTSLPCIMDVEPEHIPQLPHFIPDDKPGDLPRISKDTMVGILDGQFNQHYEKLVIIDCRFEYEYEGGHVTGAVNYNDKDQLSSQLFDIEPTSKALLIFHCEYSAHRAPIMAKFIRNKDRAVNAEQYPKLTYPELYILDGGYSSFFKDYRLRCFPQNYVEMDSKDHVQACERGLGRVKQRSKLLRAQTFAFGQHSPNMDSSPTATCRGVPDVTMSMDMDFSYHTQVTINPSPIASNNRPAFVPGGQHTRRMFSY